MSGWITEPLTYRELLSLIALIEQTARWTRATDTEAAAVDKLRAELDARHRAGDNPFAAALSRPRQGGGE